MNILAFLIYVIPGGDVGIAIIILTILVKAALYPLSQRSIESQAKMNLLAPEISKIKAKGLSREEEARHTFELYKTYKTNPFSGCLLVLIQIPIIFALYFVFSRGINFSNGILYSFIHAPEHLNMLFLGLIDISKKSLILAVLAGLSQYIQSFFMPKPNMNMTNPGSFQESFSKSMHLQMRYVFPFIITFIAYSISGAIALYWMTSNIFATFQQIYAKNKSKNHEC